jgi:hypothetical protein
VLLTVLFGLMGYAHLQERRKAGTDVRQPISAARV